MTGSRLLLPANLAVVIVVAAALLGCSSAGSQFMQPGANLAVPPQSLLPQLPVDRPSDRQADMAEDHFTSGDGYFKKSDNATVVGTSLQLPSAAGSIAWAIYQFSTNSEPLISLKDDAAIQSGGPIWLGLANYAKNLWEFAGPYTSGNVIALSPAYVSPGGNFYCVVVAYNGTALLQNTATLTLDAPPPVTINMTGGHAFDPQNASVNPGATVVFQNMDTIAPHTATVDPLNLAPGGPSSPTLLNGDSYTWTVPADAVSGTQWFYHCTFHGLAGDGSHLGTGMVGVITVN